MPYVQNAPDDGPMRSETVELTKMLNKTYSLRPHCVSCWTTFIYHKMIHGPYNVKIYKLVLGIYKRKWEPESTSYWKDKWQKKNYYGTAIGWNKTVRLNTVKVDVRATDFFQTLHWRRSTKVYAVMPDICGWKAIHLVRHTHVHPLDNPVNDII